MRAITRSLYFLRRSHNLTQLHQSISTGDQLANLALKSDGKACHSFIDNSISVSRIFRGYTSIKGGYYIKYAHLRFGVTKCRVNAVRYLRGTGQSAEVECRISSEAPESIGHVLSSCNGLTNHYTTRHNHALDMLEAALSRDGWTIHRERRIAHQGRHFEPDLLIWKPGRAMLLDVAVAFESGEHALKKSYLAKVAKYRQLSTRVMEYFPNANPLTPVEVHGVVFGARGTIYHKSLNVLRGLGVTKSTIHSIFESIAKNSIKIF